MTTSKQMTFVQALTDYFGKRPNQTATDFMREVRALTPEDRAWFRKNLATVGYEIVDVVA